ncbi:MAG: magnesium chelatase domain-containing protein, partial [Chloroflexota bacterium]
DSIQTIHQPQLDGVPGSLAQVRESTLKLLTWVKARGVPVLLAGHVTKDGAIAGPKALEHIVDVVLYLEGDSYSSYRLLRGVKNRFGSTHEVGVFEMGNSGLKEVENPSLAFLSTHPGEAVGCAVVPVMEGSRPLLVEVQALTSPAVLGPPRRLANGVDFSRLLLLAAVLSQRAGLALGGQDIVVNVVGGYRVSEPVADLAIALAIASSLKGMAVTPHTVVMGEVGLTGELRPVPRGEARLAEAQRLGFRRCLASLATPLPTLDMEVIPVDNLRQALSLGLVPKRRANERDKLS